MTDHSQRPRLLWVTNVATPYRAPLWAALGQRTDLTIALLAESEPNREWHVDLAPGLYGTVKLKARTMTTFGDSVIYGPSLRLLRLINSRPAVVVMDGWESPAYLLALWWARQLKIPVMASYRSTLTTHRFSTGPVSALRRWFFRGVDAVLTAGPASTRAILAVGVDRERVSEGFNAVDVQRFAQGAEASRRTQPPRPGHHYLYVGQFIARKNVGCLIEAFAANHNPKDTLTLVGSGPLEHELKILSKQLSIEDMVQFPGHLNGDDLIAAYARANTMVLPSLSEVWGLVVNEGLAAGLQVVISQRCGVVESVTEMPNVFVCPPDVAHLAEALAEARRHWRGYSINHPILGHTPTALSDVIVDAVRDITPSPNPRDANRQRPQIRERTRMTNRLTNSTAKFVGVTQMRENFLRRFPARGNALAQKVRTKVMARTFQYMFRVDAQIPMTRLGSDYGGWWVPEGILTAESICFCAGVGTDISFDLELIEQYDCTVHGIDPTPKSIDWIASLSDVDPRFHMIPVGMGGTAGEAKFFTPVDPSHVSHSIKNLQSTDGFFTARLETVAGLMAEIGVETLDLIKLDIEGAEHETIERMLSDRILPSIICVEYDQPEPLSWARATTSHLRRAGYYLVKVDQVNLTFVLRDSIDRSLRSDKSRAIDA